MDHAGAPQHRGRGTRHHHHHPSQHTHDHTINTFRLRITDLPGRFAREAPGSAMVLGHLIPQHLRIEVLADWKWVKADGTKS